MKSITKLDPHNEKKHMKVVNSKGSPLISMKKRLVIFCYLFHKYIYIYIYIFIYIYSINLKKNAKVCPKMSRPKRPKKL